MALLKSCSDLPSAQQPKGALGGVCANKHIPCIHPVPTTCSLHNSTFPSIHPIAFPPHSTYLQIDAEEACVVSLLHHHEGDPRLVAILQFGADLTHLTQLVLQHLGGWGGGTTPYSIHTVPITTE